MELIDTHPVGDKEILMTWSDGHRSLFGYDYLRLNCPCAVCCDEWSGKRLITLDRIPKNIKIQETGPVGNYALKFRWSDGHQTGIYSFEFLRRICQCGVCKPSQEKEKKECCGGH